MYLMRYQAFIQILSPLVLLISIIVMVSYQIDYEYKYIL
jgi:hypothetical protein